MIDVPWNVGDQLSGDAAWELIESPNLKGVVQAARSAQPGSYPFEEGAGERLLLTEAGVLFSYADDEGADETLAQVWAVKPTDDELLECAREFILNTGVEVCLAVHLHYSAERFSTWENDFVSALDVLYWFESDMGSEFIGQLEQRVRVQSPHYGTLVTFLTHPDDPEFAQLAQHLRDEFSFEQFYR